MVIHCSTHCDVPTTLAGDLNNGPLANDVSAPSPPLQQVESHIINKDVLVQHMSCVMLLDQHENASYSMDTESGGGGTEEEGLPLGHSWCATVSALYLLLSQLTGWAKTTQGLMFSV
ncbi:unnamed protein product [Pleuronectes platessa]|uniref:Uncharacterized protein n=1 Tax=Pleuronectes platessa TaxID=8262 RepID=A0A9N7U3A0_PLEPL|nr:unnamed protein product [Pleuronectes platessa]